MMEKNPPKVILAFSSISICRFELFWKWILCYFHRNAVQSNERIMVMFLFLFVSINPISLYALLVGLLKFTVK